MLEAGMEAPEFTAPLANDDLGEFTLSEALSDGPVVLAFFPGAFTRVCTGEMRTFRDRIDAFEGVAALYGVSTDSPFALDEFRDRHDLPFGLISDPDGSVARSYDVSLDMAALGVPGVEEGEAPIAERAVYVVDEDRTVSYAWAGETPAVEPPYEEVEAAAADA